MWTGETLHPRLGHVEESRIFDELLSRFGTINKEQTQVVGVTREWCAMDLLGIWCIGSKAPRSRYWNSRPARVKEEDLERS